MARISYKNDRQKEFGKHFDTLCGSRSRWQAWSDFVHLAGYAISNSVDTIHKEHREQEYLRIAKGYTASETETMSKLLAVTVMALDENSEQDFLGELYMMLDLGNSNAGQFFTPYSVCSAMADISVGSALKEQLREKGWISVNDPCVGGGALLIAFANSCKREDINYQQKVWFIGQDLDHNVAMMTYIQLTLLGCAGYVVVGNSLTEPLTSADGSPLFAPMDREVYITPMYCNQTWEWRRRWNLTDRLIRSNFQADAVLPEADTEPLPGQIAESAENDDYAPVQMSLFDM